MMWFLNECLAVAGQFPKCLTCDFSYATINASRKSYSNSLNAHDDWNLNDRKQINFTNFLRSRGQIGADKEVKQGLFSLSSSRTSTQFLSERDEL